MKKWTVVYYVSIVSTVLHLILFRMIESWDFLLVALFLSLMVVVATEVLDYKDEENKEE